MSQKTCFQERSKEVLVMNDVVGPDSNIRAKRFGL